MKAIVHFELPQLYVDPSALGHRCPVTFEGWSMVIVLPSDTKSFGLPGGIGEARAIEDMDSEGSQLVRVVRVEVQCEGTLSAARAHVDEAEREAANELLDRAIDAATRMFGSVVDALRTTGDQYWLGTSHVPPSETWISGLFDDKNERFPRTVTIRQTMWASSDRMTKEEFNDCVDVGLRGVVSMPRLLLADAQNELHQTPVDTRRAVLFSAIAAETMIKQTLVAKASPEKKTLVELLLTNPRDFSMAVASLYDKVAEPVFGTSLKDADSATFKRVEKLFQIRNRLAHADKRPTEEDARACVKAARDAIDWVLRVTMPTS